jgi:hypothetical protein
MVISGLVPGFSLDTSTEIAGSMGGAQLKKRRIRVSTTERTMDVTIGK